MFKGKSFPKELDDGVFESWLVKGRNDVIGFQYLLIIWDSYERRYFPDYAERREDIKEYEPFQNAIGRESLIAVYDLYSESRII